MIMYDKILIYIFLMVIVSVGFINAMEDRDSLFTHGTTVPISQSEPICGICRVGENLIALPCHHTHQFHESCLNDWKRIKTTCPICSKGLPLSFTESVVDMCSRRKSEVLAFALISGGMGVALLGNYIMSLAD